MPRLNAGQWFEVIFWIAFAVFAYAVSYNFDREIEIYRYGAAGWPRVVIGLIFLAAVGQFFQDILDKRAGPGDGGVETASDYFQAMADRGLGFYGRVAITLALPLVYASVLDISGFYFTTPFFIAAYLYAVGEHRVKWLIVVPLIIYSMLLLAFTKLLFVGLPVGYVRPFYDFSNWLLVLIR